MSNLYRRYMNLCKSWPIDVTKEGRDFGQYLRKRSAVIFKDGEVTSIGTNYWEPRIAALEKIAKDIHLEEHKMLYPSSATGVDAVTARQAVSNDTLATPVKSLEQNLFQDLKVIFQDVKPTGKAYIKKVPKDEKENSKAELAQKQ